MVGLLSTNETANVLFSPQCSKTCVIRTKNVAWFLWNDWKKNFELWILQIRQYRIRMMPFWVFTMPISSSVASFLRNFEQTRNGIDCGFQFGLCLWSRHVTPLTWSQTTKMVVDFSLWFFILKCVLIKSVLSLQDTSLQVGTCQTGVPCGFSFFSDEYKHGFAVP